MALDKIKTDVITDDAITVAKMNTDTGVQPTHHKVPVYANNDARDAAIGSPANGMIIYNTAAQALQQYNGTWSAIEPAPVLTSVTPTEVASAAGGTVAVVITGANFKSSGMVVSFIANSGSDITSGITVTHTSSTSLTATLNKNLFVDANEPYDVKVTSAGGLSTTIDDAIRVDNAPSFSAAANTLVATIREDATNATHATIAATDPESDAITFSEVGTTLYDKFTSATPRGVQSDGTIKGVPADVSADETTTFTVRATSTGDGGAPVKNTDQNFRFTIEYYLAPTPFAGKAYNGNNSTQSITLDETGNFKPDFVWIKCRNQTYSHSAFDSVRGAQKGLYPDLNATQATHTDQLSSFDADGFTLGSSRDVNGESTARPYIAWTWQAGGAPSGSLGDISSSGTGAGTITGASDTGWGYVSSATNITQSVNQNNGFSITKFQGAASGCAFPHNLGGTPGFIMIKNLDDTQVWSVWHPNLTATSGYRLQLDDNGTETSGQYYSTAPSSTTITCGSDDGNGGSTHNFICYAWKPVSGFSAFGTYAGGTTDKTLDLDFFPRFFMTKRINGSAHWVIVDTFRSSASSSGDSMLPYLVSNNNETEASSNDRIDLYESGSTKGVQFKSTDNYTNQSGGTYVYVAFA